MILKAVILTLALVAVSGDLPKVSDKQVATVVWDYLNDESTSAKEEAEQNSELTQRLKTLFQNHFWEQFRDKPYTYDVKDLVPFAIKLHQRLTKDSEKLKEENQKELEDLRAKMLPHAQEVSQKIADNLRLLREEIFEYPKMMYRDIDSQRWMVRVRTNTFTKRIETVLRDHADELQALLASIAKELQADIGNDMVENQMRPMAYVMELKWRIDHHMEELRRSLAPFAQDVQEQLKHQLEGLSFLMKKNADQLVANVTAKDQEQWPRLKNLTEDAGEKLKGNSEDPQKVLAELGRLLDQQLEEYQRMVGLYEEAFKNVTVQLMEEFGQKLGPDAGDDREDYLIFLEKELKDKVKSFFNNVKKENEDKNLTLREQAQNPAPSQESPAPSEQSPTSSP